MASTVQAGSEEGSDADGRGGRWKLRPQGDRCVTIDIGGEVDVATARSCAMLSRALRQAALPGITDLVPSFTAVAVHFRPLPGQAIDTAAMLEAWLAQHDEWLDAETPSAARTIDIPVCYGGTFGPDLADVAQALGLSPEAVVDLHSRDVGTVMMIGFAPGHPYIGLSDPRLSIPRRRTPRVRVEGGSVAIANRQTAIYPSELPAGWHVIGRTPLTLFDASRPMPALLAAGDRVRFVPVSSAQFGEMAAAAGGGS